MKNLMGVVRKSTGLLMAGLITMSSLASAAPSTEAVKTARSAPVAAVAKVPTSARRLTIGTKVAPPFAFKDESGKWKGISIDLWSDLAAELGVKYDFKEYKIKGLLAAVEKKEIDAAIAAITVTSEREKLVDFTHPFYHTGLGIAVQPAGESNPVYTVLMSFFSKKFLGYLAGLIGVLFTIGLLIWLIERKANSDDFSPGPKGIWDGFWWSAVTMTTVGYGDAAPKTVLGRALGLVWMFSAIIIISFFTAGIASSITVNSLETRVTGPADLPHVRVGTLSNSSSQRYLVKREIKPRGFSSVSAGLAAVAAKEIDAFVHDRPILQYYQTGDLTQKVTILDLVFNDQSYGIGLPTQSELREGLNTAILRHQSDEVYWESLTSRYLAQ